MIAKPRILAASIALQFSLAANAIAQQGDARILGFSDDGSIAERALEKKFAENLNKENLRTWLKKLSAKPHPGGSEAGRDVANHIAEKYREWGYDVQVETVYGLAPTPKVRIVKMIAPFEYSPALEDKAVGDYQPDNADDPLPPFNAYSKDGDVTAAAVYVNYGLPEDYDELVRRGVDIKGKIVIVRLGGAFRGAKPQFAYKRGAVGAILYPDPRDVGYGHGPVYPDGPFLPASGYQRGSVLNIPHRAGDPLSPFRGSTTKPSSFDLDGLDDVLSPIPVLSLSAEDVTPILGAMDGEAAPSDWQGALPVAYRTGCNVTLRIKVEQAWRIAPFYNVIAKLEGGVWPNEWVIHGNNHDSWGYGAMVALSGLVAQMEAARNIAALAKSGWRPQRTIIFAAWDGEEHALLGSTEWAETNAADIRKKAVAYINTGVNTKGFLEAGGSHSLERLVNEVSRAVDDPVNSKTVFSRKAANIEADGGDVDKHYFTQTGAFRLEALGLGSDQTPFLHHLGVPTLDLGYGGEAPTGVYHSIHDNFDSYSRFGDPGFYYGNALAETAGKTVLRLANADIVPFDFVAVSAAITSYARDVKALIEDGDSAAAHSHSETANPAFSVLDKALSQLAVSAARYKFARDAYWRSGTALSRSKKARLNRILYHAERKLAPKRGLPGRPWYRHHIYAPDNETGYGAMTLPSIRAAAKRRDWDAVNAELQHVADIINTYSDEIDKASEILEDAVD